MLKKIFLILLVILLHFNGINNMSGYINVSNGDLFKFLNLLFLLFYICPCNIYSVCDFIKLRFLDKYILYSIGVDC